MPVAPAGLRCGAQREQGEEANCKTIHIAWQRVPVGTLSVGQLLPGEGECHAAALVQATAQKEPKPAKPKEAGT